MEHHLMQEQSTHDNVYNSFWEKLREEEEEVSFSNESQDSTCLKRYYHRKTSLPIEISLSQLRYGKRQTKTTTRTIRTPEDDYISTLEMLARLSPEAREGLTIGRSSWEEPSCLNVADEEIFQMEDLN